MSSNSLKPLSTIFNKVLDLEDFIDESKSILSDYICCLCKGVYITPLLDPSGHIFCRQCIHTSLEKINICPQGGEFVKVSELTPIKFVEAILEKQTVYCRNKEVGCEWTGRLSLLFSHVNGECINQFITCENKGCGINITKEKMQEHLNFCQFRQIQCKNNCGSDSFITPFTENDHLEICVRELIPCPKNCERFVERGELENHFNTDCKKLDVECIYKKYGCHIILKKNELKEHLREFSHIHNALGLKFIFEIHKHVENKIDNLKDQKDRIFSKLENIKEIIENKEKLLGVQKVAVKKIDNKNNKGKGTGPGRGNFIRKKKNTNKIDEIDIDNNNSDKVTNSKGKGKDNTSNCKNCNTIKNEITNKIANKNKNKDKITNKNSNTKVNIIDNLLKTRITGNTHDIVNCNMLHNKRERKLSNSKNNSKEKDKDKKKNNNFTILTFLTNGTHINNNNTEMSKNNINSTINEILKSNEKSILENSSHNLNSTDNLVTYVSDNIITNTNNTQIDPSNNIITNNQISETDSSSSNSADNLDNQKADDKTSPSFKIDPTHISQGVKIEGLKATYINTNMDIDIVAENTTIPKPPETSKLIFLNMDISKITYKWKITFNNAAGDIGIGLCSRNWVYNNNFSGTEEFLSVVTDYNFNGAFLISNGGFLWNSKNQIENGKTVLNFPQFPKLKNNDSIIIEYLSDKKELIFYFELATDCDKEINLDKENENENVMCNSNFLGKLTDVKAFEGEILVPCVILTEENDSITLEKLI